jgi:peptidoglycan-associated lipoprotein
MFKRTITFGALALIWATAAIAQERGTLEIGGFGSVAAFNNSLTLTHAYGGGGRIGVFLTPSLSAEFEDGEMRATRTLGLRDVNVGILSSRLTAVPVKYGAFSLLVGAGAGIGTETNFLHSYGLNTLLGVKLALNDHAALRMDGIVDWLANNNWKSFQSLHVGLSLYRSPRIAVMTQTVTVQGPTVMGPQRPDSVSAEEQARLRRASREYTRLRDSLARPQPVSSPSSAAALATMNETIRFATDKAELSVQAKAALDSKVQVFRANPSMRIIIVGNTDERASDSHNMVLGQRRSAAAKAYLVSQGVDAGRIEISSEGERNPAAAGASASAEAINRRDEFRLLIASDFLVPPAR